MSFSVNDPFLYLLSAIIVVFVIAQSVFFLIKASRRAQQMGIAAGTVRKTILSSALFSIAPAVSILMGVITLSQFIGLPFPWLRLSVLGAVTYELPAASIAAASILAKVSRDRYVIDVLDKQYPEYQFARHKGYGTKLHYEMLDKFGPCAEHRMSFLKKWSAGGRT